VHWLGLLAFGLLCANGDKAVNTWKVKVEGDHVGSLHLVAEVKLGIDSVGYPVVVGVGSGLTQVCCDKGTGMCTNHQGYVLKHNELLKYNELCDVKGLDDECVLGKFSNDFFSPNRPGETYDFEARVVSSRVAVLSGETVELSFACIDKYGVFPDQGKTVPNSLLLGPGVEKFPKSSFVSELFSQGTISRDGFSCCLSKRDGAIFLGGVWPTSVRYTYTPIISAEKLVSVQLEGLFLLGSSDQAYTETNLKSQLAGLNFGSGVTTLENDAYRSFLKNLKTFASADENDDIIMPHNVRTPCFSETEKKKLPVLAFLFHGSTLNVESDNYLYEKVIASKQLYCLSIIPGTSTALGLRLFFEKVLMFDFSLSMVGFATGPCSTEPAKDSTTMLLKGVQMLDIVAKNRYQYYKFPISGDAFDVAISVSSFRGDPDLYVTFGDTLPTREKYDVASFVSQTLEYVSIDKTKLKGKTQMCIGVYGHFDQSYFSIVAYTPNDMTSAVTLLDGFSVIVNSAKLVHFSFDPVIGSSFVSASEIAVVPLGGDADVFVSKSKVFPDPGNRDTYEQSATHKGGEEEFLSIPSVKNKRETLRISVRTLDEQTKYSITATSATSTLTLQSGKVVYFNVRKDGYQYFKLFSNKEKSDIQIYVRGFGTADPDVFVGCELYPIGTKNGKPSEKHYKWMSMWKGSDSIVIEASDANYCESRIFYIAVQGFKAGRFSIFAVKDTDGPFMNLVSGVAQYGVVGENQYRFYQLQLPKESHEVLIHIQHVRGSRRHMYLYATDEFMFHAPEGDDFCDSVDPAKVPCEGHNGACKCSTFGARGHFGLVPGCGRQFKNPEEGSRDYCYVRDPVNCELVDGYVEEAKKVKGNRFKFCKTGPANKHQLPIQQNEHSYKWSMDGAQQQMKIKIGKKMSKLTMGVYSEGFHASYMLTATVNPSTGTSGDGGSKVPPISHLTSAVPSSGNMLLVSEKQYFSYHMDPDTLKDPEEALSILVTVQSGLVALYVSRTEQYPSAGSSSWQSLNINSGDTQGYIHIDLSKPCEGKHTVQGSCDRNKILDPGEHRGLFFIGVEAKERSIFSVTALVGGDYIHLSEGITFNAALTKHGAFGALFEFEPNSPENVIHIEQRDRNLTQGEWMCPMHIYVVFCDSDQGCKRREGVPSSTTATNEGLIEKNRYGMATKVELSPIVLRASKQRFHIGVFAPSTSDECIQDIPFSIVYLADKKKTLIDGNCLKSSTQCMRDGIIENDDAKVFEVSGEVDIELESCRGSLSLAICAQSFRGDGTRTKNGEQQECGYSNTNFFKNTGTNGVVTRDHDLTDPKKPSYMTYILSLRGTSANIPAEYQLRFIDSSSRNKRFPPHLHNKRFKVDTTDSTKIVIKQLDLTHDDIKLVGGDVPNPDQLVFSVLIWKKDSVAHIEGAQPNTPCGIDYMKKQGIVEKHGCPNLLETDCSIPKDLGEYQVTLLVGCQKGCGNLLFNYLDVSLTMKHRHRKHKGWIVSLVLISLLLIAVVLLFVARKLHREKNILASRLEYEMHDVRNMATSQANFAQIPDAGAGVSLLQESDELGDQI